MGIGLAVVLLTYFLIVVMAYVFIKIPKNHNEKDYMIINKSFQNAFSILGFGLLIIIALVILPHIPTNFHITSYMLLAIKFFSALTLAGSIFVLSKKLSKN